MRGRSEGQRGPVAGGGARGTEGRTAQRAGCGRRGAASSPNGRARSALYRPKAEWGPARGVDLALARGAESGGAGPLGVL